MMTIDDEILRLELVEPSSSPERSIRGEERLDGAPAEVAGSEASVETETPDDPLAAAIIKAVEDHVPFDACEPAPAEEDSFAEAVEAVLIDEPEVVQPEAHFDWGRPVDLHETSIAPETEEQEGTWERRSDDDAARPAEPTYWQTAEDEGPGQLTHEPFNDPERTIDVEAATDEPTIPTEPPKRNADAIAERDASSAGKTDAQTRRSPPLKVRRHKAQRAPRRRAGTTRVGLVGGKESGKTYLFQAMVYRSSAGRRSGALRPFIVNNSIMRARHASDERETFNLQTFSEPYRRWERLATTTATEQLWYRLELNYRTGLLRKTRALALESFDGSGERLAQAINDGTRGVWQKAYSQANVMIFCLPLWVAFPGPSLDADSQLFLETAHKEFFQIIDNFKAIRKHVRCTHPVTTILALTMADDPRGGLPDVRDRWIFRAIDSQNQWLRAVSTATGVARYLSQARELSAWLHTTFDELPPDNNIASIPTHLELGRGKPWILPVSAIDGAKLDRLEHQTQQSHRPASPPIPAHVELPLLVAMCESLNAMM